MLLDLSIYIVHLPFSLLADSCSTTFSNSVKTKQARTLIEDEIKKGLISFPILLDLLFTLLFDFLDFGRLFNQRCAKFELKLFIRSQSLIVIRTFDFMYGLYLRN